MNLLDYLGETVLVQTQSDQIHSSTFAKLIFSDANGALLDFDGKKTFYTWGFIRKIEQHKSPSPEFVALVKKILGENAEMAQVGDVIQANDDARIKFTVGYVGEEYAFESPQKRLGTWMLKHGDYSIVQHAHGFPVDDVLDEDGGDKPEPSISELVEMLLKHEGVLDLSEAARRYFLPVTYPQCRVLVVRE